MLFCMAKDPKATPKGPRSARGKKARPKRGERWRQLLAAYRITRQRDRRLPLWMVLAFFAGLGLVLLVLTLLGTEVYFAIPAAVLFGVLGMMIIFGRRAQKAAFREVEGQPGAAAWVLQGMRGNWRVTQGVALSAQLDAVHRVLRSEERRVGKECRSR